eukprot:TRINITY_DN103329_c0_g1_i1.p2 TRINITY_DN103329_c0_g1~~TRINITY_DN103329_c0_g1_i1.p2  ORF type:complete len:339 (+),score=34.78 TRINITY_DN103329_c0_g1_i1:27-1043(+)
MTQFLLLACLLLVVPEAFGLIDAECNTNANNSYCDIKRPHYLYDEYVLLKANRTLTLDNVLHCVHHACVIDMEADHITLTQNAHITASAVNMIATTVRIYGTINTNGRGYLSDRGMGPGSVPISPFSGAIGGGYNGPGKARCHGNSFGSSVTFGFGEFGDAEENLETFEHHIGSGGGQGMTEEVRGGAGGGAVKIVGTESLVMDGRITANGQPGQPGVDGSCDGGGGGSGGSVWIEAPVINGTGEIWADGGKGGMTFDTRVQGVIWSAGCYAGAEYGQPGGNGEGGRIVTMTPTVHMALQMSVAGGVITEWQCVNGGTGRVFQQATRYFNPPFNEQRD